MHKPLTLDEVQAKLEQYLDRRNEYVRNTAEMASGLLKSLDADINVLFRIRDGLTMAEMLRQEAEIRSKIKAELEP